MLWIQGVQMLDEYHKDSFTLREIIFVKSMITLFSSHYTGNSRERLVVWLLMVVNSYF